MGPWFGYSVVVPDSATALRSKCSGRSSLGPHSDVGTIARDSLVVCTHVGCSLLACRNNLCASIVRARPWIGGGGFRS